MTNFDEAPLRIWWNKNLHGKITPGKLAAHAAHAALRAYGIEYEHPIVVLAAGKGRIEAMPINVHDEGRTELAPGTLTTGVEDTSHRDWLAQTVAAEIEKVAEIANRPAGNGLLDFPERQTIIVNRIRTRAATIREKGLTA